jgi:YggT family protein
MVTIFSILSFVLGFYSLLVLIRVLLSWFSPWQGIYGDSGTFGGAIGLLARITDPYLNLFSRIRFLRAGMFDFSPILALGVLQAVQSIVDRFRMFGRASLGIALSVVISAAWSIVGFILGFSLLALIIRLVMYAANARRDGLFMRLLDSICEPLMDWTDKIFKRRGGYTKLLTRILSSAGLFAGFYIVGKVIATFAISLLVRLPL